MENLKVIYGFKKGNINYGIVDDFCSIWNYYSEEVDGFTFYRNWRQDAKSNYNTTLIMHDNLRIVGINNRYDYWSLVFFENENNTHVFEKKNKSLYYRKNDKILWEKISNHDNLRELYSKVDIKKVSEMTKDESIISFLCNYLIRNEESYKKIKNKKEFIIQLREYLQTLVLDSVDEVDDFCADKIYNYLYSESINQNSAEFLNIEKKLKRSDKLLSLNLTNGEISEIIENKKREWLLSLPSIFEIDWQEVMAEFFIEIENKSFQNNMRNEKYSPRNICAVFEQKVKSIKNIKDFMEELAVYIEGYRDADMSEESFYSDIEFFIDLYINSERKINLYQRFVDDFGADKIVIDIDDEKHNLFYGIEKLSTDQEKERILYKKLIDDYNKSMYQKGGKILKTSFRMISKYIDYFKNLIKIAEKNKIIIKENDKYSRVSIANIEQFYKDIFLINT